MWKCGSLSLELSQIEQAPAVTDGQNENPWVFDSVDKAASPVTQLSQIRILHLRYDSPQVWVSLQFFGCREEPIQPLSGRTWLVLSNVGCLFDSPVDGQRRPDDLQTWSLASAWRRASS